MKRKIVASPYLLWSLLFIVAPFIVVIIFAFMSSDGGFTVQNFADITKYSKIFIRSLNYAFIATVICLIIGYPLAYIMANSKTSSKAFYMVLLLLPMWMNFVLRTQAIKNLIMDNGIINKIIVALGGEPITMFGTSFAVILGLVYNYLPFMVLPIYTILNKMDKSVIEAASDLGANNISVFRKIILPLSIPGVVSGIIMVFIPAISTFVISEKLGGGKYDLIGDVIQRQFLGEIYNPYVGAAISLIMMGVILLSLLLINCFDDETKESIVV